MFFSGVEAPLVHDKMIIAVNKLVTVAKNKHILQYCDTPK